ncbi:hypothetical protein TNCV_1516981 [Trichonephila clavipes]|nr:hypothetical protein TNCV_1516981 [Trichonephila clavipes]
MATTTSWLSRTTSLSGLKPILFSARGLNNRRVSSSTLDLTIRGLSITALRSREKLCGDPPGSHLEHQD